jgi:uridylate kinase
VNRVLLKLSGEALGTSGGIAVDPAAVARLASELHQVHQLGVEIAIVLGGGNILRGALFSEAGTNRAVADQMGMLATVINALALSDALERLDIPTRVCSAVEMNTVAEPFIRRRVIRHLEKGRIALLAGGTGNPYFTTDTAAALRATEIGADVLIKGTKVDGVYDKDPVQHPDAKRFDQLTYREVLDRGLGVMDSTAITLCLENNLPIVVCNLFEQGNLVRVVKGENLGTWVR